MVIPDKELRPALWVELYLSASNTTEPCCESIRTESFRLVTHGKQIHQHHAQQPVITKIVPEFPNSSANQRIVVYGHHFLCGNNTTLKIYGHTIPVESFDEATGTITFLTPDIRALYPQNPPLTGLEVTKRLTDFVLIVADPIEGHSPKQASWGPWDDFCSQHDVVGYRQRADGGGDVTLEQVMQVWLHEQSKFTPSEEQQTVITSSQISNVVADQSQANNNAAPVIQTLPLPPSASTTVIIVDDDTNSTDSEPPMKKQKLIETETNDQMVIDDFDLGLDIDGCILKEQSNTISTVTDAPEEIVEKSLEEQMHDEMLDI